MHHIYLIPGFFGFSNLGGIHYFRAVRENLIKHFAQEGQEVFVSGVSTFPTGSLKRRTNRLLEEIIENGSLEKASVIHLIGHSTGGLDARLLTSYSRDVGSEEVRKKLQKKLGTVVCLSTPHYGTPLANFFTTLYGKNLLYFVTLVTVIGLLRKPLSLAAGFFGLFSRFTDLLGLTEPLLRQLTDQLLKDFSPENVKEVRAFLNNILSDVSLMTQLTPEAMEVFDQTINPWPDVRYVSYATLSPPPLKLIKKISLKNLLTPLSMILYSTLYTLTSIPEEGFSYHPPIHGLDLFRKTPLPFEITPSRNDGVVPTLSQIYGEFRGYLLADHLDVVGHYLRGPSEKKDGADWFTSRAEFGVEAFENLWLDISQVLLEKR